MSAASREAFGKEFVHVVKAPPEIIYVDEEKASTTAYFELENISSQEISIKRIDVDCGCLTARFSEKPIKPGGTTVIAFQADLRGRHLPLFKAAIVCTAGPADDRTVLRMNVFSKADKN